MIRLRHWHKTIWLALFAIWVQLVFAFGHIPAPSPLHVEGWLGSTIASAGGDLGRATHHPADEGDHCAICWLQSVAGTLLLPAFLLLFAVLVYLPFAWPSAETGAASLPHSVSYLVRGPPAARLA